MTTKHKVTKAEIAEAVSELSEDGDTYELKDGRVLRLKIEQDDLSYEDMEDPELFGRFEYLPRSIWDSEGSRIGRPDGFDGNAEKMQFGNSDPYWWQPPKDLKRGMPEFTKFRDYVRDIVEFGYSYVRLELLDGLDAYGHGVVSEFAGLGGIEPFPNKEYMAEIVGDLIGELL